MRYNFTDTVNTPTSHLGLSCMRFCYNALWSFLASKSAQFSINQRNILWSRV